MSGFSIFDSGSPPIGLGLELGRGSVDMLGCTKSCGFTFLQLQELEHQALIYKYMEAGLPVPYHLVYPIWKSVACSLGGLAPGAFHHQPAGGFTGLGLFTERFHFSFLGAIWERFGMGLVFNLFCLCFQFWGSVLCIWTIKTAWIQSQGDAGEQMGRNGGVAKKQCRIRSTVSGTCTEAASVQESMWKLPNLALGQLLLPLITQSEMLSPQAPISQSLSQ